MGDEFLVKTEIKTYVFREHDDGTGIYHSDDNVL